MGDPPGEAGASEAAAGLWRVGEKRDSQVGGRRWLGTGRS